MRDLLADWNKWNSAERLLALVLALTFLIQPAPANLNHHSPALAG